MSEIVVIGAGLVGSAVAHRLAEAGESVTVLEAGQPGYLTSAASVAWINSSGKTPRAYHDLNVAGMRGHRALRDEFGAAPWLHEGGNLEWDETAKERAELRTKVNRMQEWGYRVEWIDPAQARELEPDLPLDPAVVTEVAYYPEEGWVDPLLLVSALLGAAVKRGARLRTGTRLNGIVVEGGRVAGVRTSNGERIHADVVVNCAGPHAAEVAKMVGFDLPMANTIGLVAVTTPAPIRINRVIHAPEIHLRPDGAGRLMLHQYFADQTVTTETRPDPALAGCTEMLHRAQRLLPKLVGAQVESARIGTRPIPQDGIAAVGPVPGVSGTYVVVTHSAATLCLILGTLVAQELATGQVEAALAPFRPARFAAASAKPA